MSFKFLHCYIVEQKTHEIIIYLSTHQDVIIKILPYSLSKPLLCILSVSMKFYLILISLLLGACSTLPPAFKDPHITNISYAEVNADIKSYKKTLVRWGGVIVDVKSDENFSWMEVIFYPLDYYGRPKINKPSEGRFVIKSPEFLDPKNYAKNREIIAVGIIEGKTEHTDSHMSSSLPLIKATAIHLWPINYRDNYYGHRRSCYFMQLFW